MSNPIATPCTSPTDITTFVTIIASAFSTTGLTTAFICEIDSLPPPSKSPPEANPITLERRIAHFSPGILSASSAGADLIQAGNFSALALWEPPNFEGQPFDQFRPNPCPILAEWREHAKRMRSTYLAGPFYHLSFLARNPNVEPVRGAISAVLTPYLKRCISESLPAWLEATNPHAVSVYQHYGFQVCEEVTVGLGKCDARGWPKAGGEGVTAWGMVFDGHLTKHHPNGRNGERNGGRLMMMNGHA